MSGDVQVPREAWAACIARSYGGARASDDVERKRARQVPLSLYEPCERCGILVVTIAEKGVTAVVEVAEARMTDLWSPIEYREDGSVIGSVRLETSPHLCRPVSREQSLADFQALLERV